MSYLYVKTCYEKENGKNKKDRKIRVRVLGGQKSNNIDLDVTKNVSCWRGIREEYPIGSIFGFSKFEFQDRKKFYNVKDNKLTPVEVNNEVVEKNPSNHRILDHYEEFYPYMKNAERKMVLDWILSDDDIPL